VCFTRPENGLRILANSRLLRKGAVPISTLPLITDNQTMCELCENEGGILLWQDVLCRVVLVEDCDYPGFCRIIWTKHVKEMTDLPVAERRHLMDVVFAVEGAVRQKLKPDKINLASLGNLTPHLHWHVIPRWIGDRHFPNPIWGEMQRDARPAAPEKLAEGLRTLIHEALQPASNSNFVPACPA